MTNGQKIALILLLGIGILAISIFVVCKPNKEKIDSLEVQKSELETRLADLIEKESHKDELLAETAEFNKQFEDELTIYPADLNQESTVMFMKGVEQNNDVLHDSFTMPPEEEYYVLGSGALPGTEDATYEMPAGDDEEGSAGYKATAASYGVVYEGSYEGLKDYLKYVMDYKYRMNISSLSMVYNQDEDKVNGNIVLNGYAINGPDRTPDTVNVNVPTGTENIFLPGDGSLGVGGGAASDHDSDDGASIVGSNQLVMLLNDSESDLSSGIIVASDANDDNTIVSSDDNNVVDMKLTIEEKDGKNYMTYEIGGKSKEVEVTTPEVAVYVKSSARTGAEDKNGVNVSVNNTTAIPVYFKVVDDDTTSARFTITQRTGTVKVY